MRVLRLDISCPAADLGRIGSVSVHKVHVSTGTDVLNHENSPLGVGSDESPELIGIRGTLSSGPAADLSSVIVDPIVEVQVGIGVDISNNPDGPDSIIIDLAKSPLLVFATVELVSDDLSAIGFPAS